MAIITKQLPSRQSWQKLGLRKLGLRKLGTMEDEGFAIGWWLRTLGPYRLVRFSKREWRESERKISTWEGRCFACLYRVLKWVSLRSIVSRSPIVSSTCLQDSINATQRHLKWAPVKPVQGECLQMKNSASFPGIDFASLWFEVFDQPLFDRHLNMDEYGIYLSTIIQEFTMGCLLFSRWLEVPKWLHITSVGQSLLWMFTNWFFSIGFISAANWHIFLPDSKFGWC